jgi:hypothetical protein
MKSDTTQLWRLPVGAEFSDFHGRQWFEKIGVCSLVKSRELRHVVKCLASPFTKEKPPGEVCKAFFCAVGDVVFLGGGKVVMRQFLRRRTTGGMHRCIIARDGRHFDFRCDNAVNGVPINPVLPADFGNTNNDDRPDRHRVWWDVPYIEVYESNHPKFVEAWPEGARYDVRCLDGGAWDRPTCWGMFATLEEALACAGKGPAWLQPKEAAA